MDGSLLTLFFVALVLIELSSGQDYCNIQTCKQKGYQQTMCQYPSNGPAQACFRRGNLGGGLTGIEKNQLLNRHNDYRQLVASGGEKRGLPGPQPAAQSMPKLEWDSELETVAQRWADQCIYEHDECRDVNRFKVGQNIAWKGTTGDVNTIPLLAMVDDWYNEVKDFDRSVVSGYRSTGQKIGHYTQMVWAKTTRIGCGLRKYYDGKYNRKYLVCNYGPSGNINGAPIYEAR